MDVNSRQLLNSFIFDEPFEYKEIKFYPVSLKDYLFFLQVVDCLLIDKNSIPDSKIISMTYLDFLISTANEENRQIEKLAGLLYVCTKEPISSFNIEMNKKNNFVLVIGNSKINSSEFEEIRTIICEQNLVELPDYTIQKEIRDKIEEGKALKRRDIKNKPASFEDQIVSLSIASGIPLNQIYEMTYRKFVKSLERMEMLIHYKIFLQSSMSGFVEFKDKSFIQHWLNAPKKDAESDMIELNTMKDKINFNDKKNGG